MFPTSRNIFPHDEVLSHFWIVLIGFPCRCCSMISDFRGASFGLCGPGDFNIFHFAFIFLFLPSVQFFFAGLIASLSGSA